MKTWVPSQTETKASDSMAQDCVGGFRSFRERRGARGGKESGRRNRCAGDAGRGLRT